mgnify:CR=1 FL=1|tara:strand:+ start:1791 stop:2306 length:516 start_codon:yes stop_codon:yes gene_type:complete
MKKIAALSEVHLPTTSFEVARLQSKSVAFGLLVPQRREQGPLIVTGDGTGLTVIPLEGRDAFRHFGLSLGTPLRGLLLSDVQFRVDITSQFNPNTEEPLGGLLRDDMQIRLLVANRGESFADPVRYPLIDLDGEEDQDWSTGFRSWSILHKLDDGFVELWRNDGAEIPLER